MINVLLSSVGRRSYLVDYFKRALAGRGMVYATNSVEGTAGMRAADKAEQVPPANHPEFINKLLSICSAQQIKLLFSLHDWEAPFIASARERFLAAGTFPVMPEKRIVDMCLDKFETYLFAKENNLLFPESFITLESAREALDHSRVQFPLIVKPRWGQGSIALFKVQSVQELECAYSLTSTQLNRLELDYLASDQTDHQVLIQEAIEGQEYGVDIVNDLEGNFATAFVKMKHGMRSGETDSAETVNSPEIADRAARISQLTRHPGSMDADFFVTDIGAVYLLEMNPRFGGGYPFSHVAGANIPAALLAWAEGAEADPDTLKVELGVRAFKDIQIVRSEPSA